MRASDTSELIFEDCEIPAENMVGKEGDGFKDAMRVLDGGRISIAALSLGMARGALDAAMKYAQERRQFGKTISEFQAIQFKLARHGDAAGCGAVADDASGADEGRGEEGDAGVGDGEAVCERGGVQDLR